MQTQSADAIPFASIVFAANPPLSRVVLDQTFRGTVKSSLATIKKIAGMSKGGVIFSNDLTWIMQTINADLDQRTIASLSNEIGILRGFCRGIRPYTGDNGFNDRALLGRREKFCEEFAYDIFAYAAALKTAK